jgi:glycine cleavage system protein P-like pyridoxal-binding family
MKPPPRPTSTALWSVARRRRSEPCRTSPPSPPASTGTLPAALLRQSPILSHPVFNRYHSETELMRYLRKLADKDLALDRTMIPLGSCTMKLNAASEMIPVTWAEFGGPAPVRPGRAERRATSN